MDFIQAIVAAGGIVDGYGGGTLSCSGGDGFLLYAPPLPVHGRLKKSHSGASCDLLVQLQLQVGDTLSALTAR